VMLHLSTKEIAKSNITKEVIAAEEGVHEVGMVDQQYMNGKNSYVVLIKLEQMVRVEEFMEKGVINNHEVKMTKYEKTVKMHVEFLMYGMGVSKCGDDGLNDLMSMLGNDIEVTVDGKQHKGLGPLTSKWPPHMLNKGVMKLACSERGLPLLDTLMQMGINNYKGHSTGRIQFCTMDGIPDHVFRNLSKTQQEKELASGAKVKANRHKRIQEVKQGSRSESDSSDVGESSEGSSSSNKRVRKDGRMEELEKDYELQMMKKDEQIKKLQQSNKTLQLQVRERDEQMHKLVGEVTHLETNMTTMVDQKVQ